MCLAVYIASNIELPLIPWDESNRKFYIDELPKHDSSVQSQFRFQYIRYAGSHLGCGCGFFKDGIDPAELEDAQCNYEALAAYIDMMLRQGAHCAIYACWEGDQGEPREQQMQLTTKDLVAPGFEFREKAFYEFA